MNIRKTTGLLILSLFILSSGCAHLRLLPENEKTLQKKIRIEWEAKIQKDWGMVYDLAVEEYKKKVKCSQFIQGANINVTGFEIKEVKIIEPKKKALSTVSYTIDQMGFKFNMTAREEWLMEDNAWRLNLLPLLKMMMPSPTK